MAASLELDVVALPQAEDLLIARIALAVAATMIRGKRASRRKRAVKEMQSLAERLRDSQLIELLQLSLLPIRT